MNTRKWSQCFSVSLASLFCSSWLISSCGGAASEDSPSSESGSDSISDIDDTKSDNSNGDENDDDDDTEESNDSVETDTEDTDTEEETGDVASPLARGIKLSLVEVTQGVQVVLSRDGEEVPVDERVSDLIENRAMLVRAHWTLPEDWSSREIEAVLTLRSPDGMTEEMPLRKMIENDSNPNRLNSTFNWKLEAETVLEGLKMSVEFREIDDSMSDEPAPDPAPRYPFAYEADLNVVSGPMELRVKVIRGETESGFLAAEDEHQQTLIRRLQDANPTQQVILEVSEPIPHDNFENANEMFRFLRELREEEEADPNVYYHLMLLRKDHDMGWSGIANLPGASKQAASRRISITLTRDNIGRGAGVVLHELGHNQGRRHAPCGGAGGPDPDYPYDNGIIGIQGYSLQRERLYDPAEVKDYMSYCGPSWVSDYYWRLYIERIRELSSWGYGSGLSELRGKTLIGWIDGDGTASWQIVRGAVAEDQATRSSNHQARFWREGVVRRELPIAIEAIEHTDSHEVYIPYGDHLDAEMIEVQVFNQRFQVDPANIHHIAK